MLTTLSIGTVLAFLLTGFIFGAFTRSENVKGSPIFDECCTQPGKKIVDQVDQNITSPGVQNEIQTAA